MKTTTFRSEEISCEGCTNAIQKALTTLPGVANVSVDVGEKSIAVEHEEEVVGETLADKLERAGFPVEPNA